MFGLAYRLSFVMLAISLGSGVNLRASESDDVIAKVFAGWTKRAQGSPVVVARWREQSLVGEERSSQQSIVKLSLADGCRSKVEVFDSKNLEECLSRSTYNGTKNFQYTKEQDEKDWPRGIVWSDSRNDEINSIQLRPWLIHFKPFEVPIPGIEKSAIRLIASGVLEQDHQCAVLEVEKPGDPIIGKYWVVPEMDYSVVKYTESHNGITTLELNVEHERTEFGWAPKSWNSAFTNGTYSVHADLISLEIKNQINDKEFEIEYPSGTVLFDRDKSSRSLVLPGGGLREITNGESLRGFTYEELKSTQSGELASDSSQSDLFFGRVLTFVVFGGIAGAFALFVVFARKG